MKTIIFSFFAVLLITGCTPPKEEIDIAKEEEAIKAVIEEATRAYYDRDLELLSATHVTDESFIRLQANKIGYTYNIGWEERISSTKENYRNNPNPVTVKIKYTNYKIKVYPNNAWAAYDQSLYNSEGNLLGMSINVRFLEKVNEEWKIVYLSTIGVTSYEDEDEDDGDDDDDDDDEDNDEDD